VNGREFASSPRDIHLIDFYGLEEDEVRRLYAHAYQHLLVNAKPSRDQNRNDIFRERWWVIGHPRKVFRDFTAGLSRYLTTIETSKHRFFAFLSSDIVPDSSLVTFGLDDAYCLGVLSSRIHIAWALATGGTLEDRPRYNKTRCFETFPFPTRDGSKSRHESTSQRVNESTSQRVNESTSQRVNEHTYPRVGRAA
jgi:hypothetical protein